MSQSDLLFLIMILIGLTSLTLVIVQLARSRRGGPEEDGHSGNWWEGPWDEDGKR